MTRIAFIGLGTMGAPMARNLVAAGHEVVGCDIDRARVQALRLPVAATPAEAAEGAEVTITSLPSSDAVEAVALGEEGVVVGGSEGSVFMDMSTSPPRLARRLAAELGARDIAVLDAPVSGGPRGAADATLTIMVGGDEETLERVRPLLDVLGRLVVHVGPHGAGQAAKLCNNLVAGATMAALAEACAIAERERIDAPTLYALLAASTGDSTVLRNRFPLAGADDAHPASRDWEPLFALDFIAKDLRLVQELAEQHGVDPGMTLAALAEYGRAQAAGHGALDYSAVFRSKRVEE